jgi:hypothetical protein
MDYKKYLAERVAKLSGKALQIYELIPKNEDGKTTIKARQLESKVYGKETDKSREVVADIKYLKSLGIPVCSVLNTNEKQGYFITGNVELLERAYKTQLQRVKTNVETLNDVEEIICNMKGVSQFTTLDNMPMV